MPCTAATEEHRHTLPSLQGKHKHYTPIGGLLGGRLSAQLPGAAPGLTALPPVVLREGRVYLGPIRLPLQPLPVLY